MKLSDLRPCIACRGSLVGPGKSPIFYVLRVTQAMLEKIPTSQVLGLTQMFGGSLRMAEAMAPNPEGAVVLFSDREPSLETTIFLCQDCALLKSPLGLWMDSANAKQEADAPPAATGATP